MIVLYDHKGLKMSQRIDWDKPMYNMWQTPGGKVEEGETSKQAALRELKEETGIQATEWNLKFILNDPKYDTDVYICRMMDYWVLKNPEPHKQTMWENFTLGEYKSYNKVKKTTPTHIFFGHTITKKIKKDLERKWNPFDTENNEETFSEILKSRWKDIHFSYMGQNTIPCLTRSQNREYRYKTYCDLNDHH